MCLRKGGLKVLDLGRLQGGARSLGFGRSVQSWFLVKQAPPPQSLPESKTTIPPPSLPKSRTTSPPPHPCSPPPGNPPRISRIIRGGGSRTIEPDSHGECPEFLGLWALASCDREQQLIKLLKATLNQNPNPQIYGIGFARTSASKIH